MCIKHLLRSAIPGSTRVAVTDQTESLKSEELKQREVK